jgi:hypothetical protein
VGGAASGCLPLTIDCVVYGVVRVSVCIGMD